LELNTRLPDTSAGVEAVGLKSTWTEVDAPGCNVMGARAGDEKAASEVAEKEGVATITAAVPTLLSVIEALALPPGATAPKSIVVGVMVRMAPAVAGEGATPTESANTDAHKTNSAAFGRILACFLAYRS
jgi:hypothetical protein